MLQLCEIILLLFSGIGISYALYGSGFIQTEATVQYKKQLFLNQEIKINITKIEIKGLRIIFEHEIFCGEDLAITGTATVLAYNYEEQKVKKVPTSFKNLVENY